MMQEAKYQAVKNFVDHPDRNKLRIAVNFSVTLRIVDRWIAKELLINNMDIQASEILCGAMT